MPYKNKSSRDYRQEYDEYQGKPEQIKKRAIRNSARAGAVKAGTAKKGDGKDVAHAKALDKGGGNGDGLRVESKSKNRSFLRDSKGNLVSEKSKKERKRT
jgi:lipopolysaccharide export LptBFGC system permease protein LptF